MGVCLNHWCMTPADHLAEINEALKRAYHVQAYTIRGREAQKQKVKDLLEAHKYWSDVQDQESGGSVTVAVTHRIT